MLLPLNSAIKKKLLKLTDGVKIHPLEAVDGDGRYGDDPGNSRKYGVNVSQVDLAPFRADASDESSNQLEDAEHQHDEVGLVGGNGFRRVVERSRFHVFHL